MQIIMKLNYYFVPTHMINMFSKKKKSHDTRWNNKEKMALNIKKNC